MTIETTTPGTAHVTLAQIDSITDAIVKKEATKLDKTVYDEGIAKKVDTTVYEAGIAEKVDTTTYEAGIAKKVDTTTYDTGMATKVDKVEGKDLSTNDYTNTEKSKLTGIAEGAQVNVLEAVKVNGTALEVTDKGVNIDLSDYAKSADLSTAVLYKGTVATYADLPSKDQKVGDLYNVTAADADNDVNAGDNFVWNGTSWDNQRGTIDLSGKVDKETGKGLSTEDFTTALKTKLENIEEATSDDVAKLVAKFA